MKEIKKKESEVSAEDLVVYARQSFGNMQKSWWEFAKTIYRIREERSYSKEVLGEDGFDSFKDFCYYEYPTVDLSVISKFCTIVENWQELFDTKLKKDPDFKLPAYEACYKLVSHKNDLAKEELSRLKKSLLDAKISYRGLQTQLKDLISKRFKESVKSVDEIEETVRKIEDDLAKDLSDDDFEDFQDFTDDALDSEDADDSEDILEDDDDDTGASISSCTMRCKYLIDNLPAVEIMMKGKKTKDLVALAESLEQLSDIANNFFIKYEKLK